MESIRIPQEKRLDGKESSTTPLEEATVKRVESSENDMLKRYFRQPEGEDPFDGVSGLGHERDAPAKLESLGLSKLRLEEALSVSSQNPSTQNPKC